jgi:hypothetical protein
MDDLSGTPSPSSFSKWVLGVIVPIGVLIYAIRCCILQEAVVFGHHGANMEISGIPAVFMGLAWVNAAFFIHFHYFWSAVKRLCTYADFAKTIALLCLIGTFGYVVWTIIM